MKANLDLLANKNALIDRAENNMREKLQYIPANLSGMTVTEAGSTLIVDSNMPSDTFNTCYGGEITQDVTTEVFNYYKEKNFPMAWWIGPSSSTPSTNPTLEAAQFTYDEYDVGMACNLTEVNTALADDAGLRIVSCQSEESFRDFGEVLASIFDPVDEAVKEFYLKVATIPAEKRAALELFVGYENDKPVATSALFKTDVAGIYDISTRPESRGKGYGTVMFHTALISAKKQGFKVSTLQASPDGLNIYKRLGFSEICEFHVWSNSKAL